MKIFTLQKRYVSLFFTSLVFLISLTAFLYSGNYAHAQQLTSITARAISSTQGELTIQYDTAQKNGFFDFYVDTTNPPQKKYATPVSFGSSNTDKSKTIPILNVGGAPLQPGTQYFVDAQMTITDPTDPNRNIVVPLSGGAASFTTPAATTQPPSISSAGEKSKTDTSITLQVSFTLGTSGGGNALFELREGSPNSTSPKTHTSSLADGAVVKEHEFTGLKPGTKYFYKIIIENNNKNSSGQNLQAVQQGSIDTTANGTGATPSGGGGSPDPVTTNSGLHNQPVSKNDPQNFIESIFLNKITDSSIDIFVNISESASASLVDDPEIIFELKLSADGNPIRSTGPEKLRGTERDQKKHVFDLLTPGTVYYVTVKIDGPNNTSGEQTRSYVTTSIESLEDLQATNTGDCVVTSITGTPSGTQPDGWFKINPRPLVTLEILGENCAGQKVLISILEEDSGFFGFNDAVYRISLRDIIFGGENKVRMTLEVGEEDCEIESSPNCTFLAGVFVSNGETAEYITSKDTWKISFDCASEDCSSGWSIKNIEPQNLNYFEYAPTKGPDPRCLDEEGKEVPNCYIPLAPLPGLPERIDDNFTLGAYFNTIIQIVIGLITLASFIVLVMAGFQFMSTDSVTGKGSARQTIAQALGGLILALGSYVLLNTLDPSLLNIEPQIQNVTMLYDGDTSLWDETEVRDSGPYAMTGTFENPQTSAGVYEFAQKMIDSDLTLKEIRVVAGAPGPQQTGTAVFIASDDSSVSIPVGLGVNGVTATNTTSASERGKTPLGSYSLNNDQRHADGPKKGVSVLSNTGRHNLGAAFLAIDIKTEDGEPRGIGFHGNKANDLSATNGCVRMKNDDLVVLFKFMKPGTPVNIVQS